MKTSALTFFNIIFHDNVLKFPLPIWFSLNMVVSHWVLKN